MFQFNIRHLIYLTLVAAVIAFAARIKGAEVFVWSGTAITLGLLVGWGIGSVYRQPTAGSLAGAVGALTAYAVDRSPVGGWPDEFAFVLAAGAPEPWWVGAVIAIIVALAGAVPAASIAANRKQDARTVCRVTIGWCATVAALFPLVCAVAFAMTGEPGAAAFLIIISAFLSLGGCIWGWMAAAVYLAFRPDSGDGDPQPAADRLPADQDQSAIARWWADRPR